MPPGTRSGGLYRQASAGRGLAEFRLFNRPILLHIRTGDTHTPVLFQRFEPDEGGSVVVTHPEGGRVGRVIDIHPANVCRSRKQVLGHFTRPDVQAHDPVTVHSAPVSWAAISGVGGNNSESLTSSRTMSSNGVAPSIRTESLW